MPFKIAITLGLLAALNLGAASVAIENPSFENPTVPSIGNSLPTIPGWTVTGTGPQAAGGLWYPEASWYGPVLPDGHIVAWASEANITQELADTYVAGTTYELTVWAGRVWPNQNPDDVFRIAFMAGGTPLPGPPPISTPTFLPLGVFQELTLSFTPDASSSAIGKKIQIGLLNPGFGEIDFDKVSLTATAAPVPEPGSALLLLLAAPFLAVGCVRARLRR